MADITSIFGGGFRPPEKKIVAPPEAQLIDAIADAGMTPPDQVHLDGKVHRFRSGTKGKGAGDKTGWYVAFGDGIAAGRFGCWRAGIEQTWRAESERDYSPAEEMALARRMAEAQALRDAERRKSQETAADTVATIWDGCTHATADHPYLSRKSVQPHGSRVTGDGRLVVPLYGEDGCLCSLQYIAHDGSKLYHAGGKTSGAFWVLGALDSAQAVYIAEGFATAATIHEATGAPCVVAYSASNLVPVSGFWREKMGALFDLVVVADHDTSGTGQKYADQCAAKYGARVVMPPEHGDVNDFKANGGDVGALLSPSKDSDPWLIPADDFCAQPAPIKWLIKGWLQQDSLIMVHGASGGGKTFVVLDMVMSIASGAADWHGKKIRGGDVVYLAGEGHAGLRGRVAGWKQARGVSKLSMWISRAGCDLNTPAGYHQAVSEIARLGVRPRIIVVDTLHRFLAGDENSAQDAKTMLDACSMLMREFGCAVLLVHHTGVSDEAQHRARGSSAWRGALDIEISVKPSKDDQPIELVQRKSKDAECADPLFFGLVSQPITGWFDEDGEQVTTAIIEPTQAAPQKSKKESKIAAHIKVFTNAWWASGAEVLDGRPYISKSAMMAHLTTSMGLTESSARMYIKPSVSGKLIADLLTSEIIAPQNHGWVVMDNDTASALMVQKNGM
jgi:phage/plasmid primase-like uncharacterized protein